MAYLNGEQRQIIREIIAGSYRSGLKGRQRRLARNAALATGKVETNFQNLRGGDRDSEGWRQERKRYYKNPRNVRAAVDRFYAEYKADAPRHGSLSARAQAVQQSAFPSRYGATKAEVQRLAKMFDRGGGSAGARGKARRPTYIEGRDEFDAKAFIRENLVGKPVKGRLENRATTAFLHELADPNSPYRSRTSAKLTPGRVTPGQRSKPGKKADTSTKGTKVFEGVRVAAWIYPELVYARKHGWTGKVNSGFRSFEEQTRIYNSGVRPAAKPGTSNHEGSDFPRGAIDVSNAEQLNAILSRKRSPLKWAGSKDPVHFSHPHGGSY